MEQPIHWGRAFLCGVIGAVFMMMFLDTFYLMGITPFNFEVYLGALIRGTQHGPQNWTLGFFASSLVGGVFGILYAYFFEYVFFRADSLLGIKLGFFHALFAAFAVFPFFGAIHEQLDTGLYPQFGILGWELGAATPILIVTGHLLFGVCVGTFYGPARGDRVQFRYFEPGETGGPLDEGVITQEEDAEDRIAV